MATGITRFKITDSIIGSGGKRFRDSERYWEAANDLYRSVFDAIGMELLAGYEVIECTKVEFEAGYDYQLGIDVILRPQYQGECTLQEKFLFTDFNSVTVEHCQDWLSLEPGDWYKLKAQYYFVGYDNLQLTGALEPWILVDWARMQRATAQRRIPWKLRSNHKDGARASLMYVEFKKVPPDVIVAPSYSLI